MAEDNISKRDMFLAKMRERYPDRQFETDDDYFGQISEDYDNYDKSMSEYKNREKELSDMFTADPRAAAFITEWRKGGDPVISLVRQFGTDIKEALDDPERLEAIAEANKEFVERVAKEKELESQFKANLEKSYAEIDKMQQEKGMSDDDMDKAMNLIAEIAGNYIVGKITPEAINFAVAAISHDADVQQAAYEGEVKGRNAKIMEELRKPQRGDGMPSGLGGSGVQGMPKPKKDMGALDRYGEDMQSVWDKGGGIKRTPRRM